MRYPKTINIFGHEIDVKISDTPYGATTSDGTELQAFTLAYFDPAKEEIHVYDNEARPSIGGSNFIHEVIEAIDVYGDLKMNHTQISTLSSALYQAFTSSKMEFAMAA